MKKDTRVETVKWLESEFVKINFPEYQREPNVWSRDAKQRLIDSMLRDFDIASLYFYKDEEGMLDCIDGRQRIGAIMSFLGKNEEDKDNGFDLKFLNEIYSDPQDRRFHQFQNCAFSAIRERAKSDVLAQELVEQIRNYELTVVLLSDSSRSEEFNLQFTRLNLGTIINSGEKLHAMVGDFRDACFENDGLGAHQFLAETAISTRRYAREQTAAQILAQVFSLNRTRTFTRTRHFDLQRFFKDYAVLNGEQRTWVEGLRKVMDLLADAFRGKAFLKNRAITVSVVLLALRVGVDDEAKAAHLADFMKTFLDRLKWQVDKYRDQQTPDLEYRYLLDFQRHLTQASVEKPAVDARAKTLEEEYKRWRTHRKLGGDAEYEERGKKPG